MECKIAAPPASPSRQIASTTNSSSARLDPSRSDGCSMYEHMCVCVCGPRCVQRRSGSKQDVDAQVVCGPGIHWSLSLPPSLPPSLTLSLSLSGTCSNRRVYNAHTNMIVIVVVMAMADVQVHRPYIYVYIYRYTSARMGICSTTTTTTGTMSATTLPRYIYVYIYQNPCS
jgi:hypothetical protein